ncbi:tetratricopeptide repeat protein [Thiovibrio sp. JS02]
MLKRLLFLPVLALLCLSCTPAMQGEVGPAQPSYAAELEPYDEALDRGCSYFNFLWGKSAELEGRLEEAVYAYKQALLCDRRADYVMRSLAMLLIKTGQRDQAIEWINKIIAQNPKDTGARALLANLYSVMERPEEAAAIYNAILAEEPQNFNVMLLLGGLHARFRQYDKARQVLENLVATNPDSYAGFYYLAKLYQEMRLYPQASEAFAKALVLNWSPLLAYEAADLYEQEGRFAEAIVLYRRILEEDPADERARGYLATVYLKQNKLPEALQELEELRAVSTDPEKIDLTICRILIDNEQYAEAVRRLKAILKKNPKAEGARSMLILSYYQQGNLAAAKKILQQVKPGDHAYEESLLMLVRILQDEKDFSGAEKVLRQAMADPASRVLNFYVALADIYHQQGKAEKAGEVYGKAFADFPGDAAPYYEYALFLHHRMNDIPAALRQMEEVLKLDPEHAHALNYVGYSWADEGKNLDQAREYIEKAVSILPKDGFVRDSLGWVYYKLGEYAKAVEALEQAVGMSPEDPTIHEHLGDAHAKNNDYDGARDAYTKSIELYQEEEKKAVVRGKLDALPAGGGLDDKGK